MQTRRFAIDSKGRRIYIGSSVTYKNSVYLVEDMKYLQWKIDQYLTLRGKKNKNKKVDFVLCNEVKRVYSEND